MSANSHHKSQNSEGKSRTSSRANWQIPSGVSPGIWDYVRNAKIAEDYDQFLDGDPLTQLDWQIISHCLTPNLAEEKPVVVEFGCGTGRTLIPLVDQGYQAVGVDLSVPMLQQMQRNFSEKFQHDAEIDEGRLVSLQGNLVELDWLADDCCDHGVCLFSTLGMIRGSEHRQRFLDHARRIIKQDGVFVLHAHNLWQQLRHPGGLRWFAGHVVDVARGRCDLGDRFSTYRNITEMYIHSFRKRELKAVLKSAGFQVEQWHRVEDPKRKRTTVGWVLVCR